MMSPPDNPPAIPWEKIEERPDKEHKIWGKAILEFRQTIEGQQGELDKQKRAFKELESEKSNVESDLKEERTKTADLTGKIASLEANYKNKVAEEKQLESDMSKKIQDLEAKIAEIEAERDRVKQAKETELEAMERQSEKFKEDINVLQERVVSIETEKKDLTNERDQLEKQVSDLQEQRDAALNQYLELEETIKKPVVAASQDNLNTARACITCKEYILFVQGDYKYVKAMQLFDAVHHAHMVSTVTYAEVKNGYISKTDEFLQKSSER